MSNIKWNIILKHIIKVKSIYNELIPLKTLEYKNADGDNELS